MRTLLGQEGPVPADAPLGEMTVPAGMLLWRAGSGSPGIPPRCVAGKAGKRGPGEGRGQTRVWSGRASYLPLATCRERAPPGAEPEEAEPRRAPGSPAGSASGSTAPANQSAGAQRGPAPGEPRPYTRSGTGDTETGHGHGTDRLLSAMDESER